MEIRPVTPELLNRYDAELEREVIRAYAVAERLRKLGRDPSDRVEIPLALDMADRIGELLQIPDIAQWIRDRKDMPREDMSLELSVKVARELKAKDPALALDKAVRVGLAILTEGILVAPLEGIASVNIVKEGTGTYASVAFAGPIRGAGGTAQALSVLIADIVRRELGIGAFVPEEAEVERYVEEIQSYNRVKHLQYLPSPDEIRLVVRNSPVCIDGEGSEKEEISGHRDMRRISTNRIRGGMCLVIGEGIIQKASKIRKYTKTMGLKEWDFLSDLGKSKKEDGDTHSKSEKFLKDIIAGRPVLSHPGRPGGFRLRYGRTRATGLAAAAIHPASMIILGGFVAVGSQMKIELPGKAAAMTACDSIDGPTVLLENGSHERIRSVERAMEVKDRVAAVTDLGDILISYGEFLENNTPLRVGAFGVERWRIFAGKHPEIDVLQTPDQYKAVEISRKYQVPLHPEYDLLFHDLPVEEIMRIRSILIGTKVENESVYLSADFQESLIKLNMEFERREERILLKWFYPLIVCLGLDLESGTIVEKAQVPEDCPDPISLVSRLAGFPVVPRSPTRIGARLGRPEKSGEREMKPRVHTLFPIENYGQSRRSVMNAGRDKGSYMTEYLPRDCPSCGNVSPVPLCEKCGNPTRPRQRPAKIELNLRDVISRAESRTGIIPDGNLEVKGVKKLMSSMKVCEPLEKGLVRARYDISVNKDGTCRFDITDVPLTHFNCNEVSLQRERAMDLGYDPDKENEIYAQDVIIPEGAAEYLLKVSQYVDHLLVHYYGSESFYSCRTREDLLGQLVIGLAPHTSAGIVGRIAGFTKVSGCLAHPFFHAAKRRNCDGDEDSIMLLLDGLLNFSRHFLPSTRGGLMDAPLVLTTKLNPDEVDKEALNVDTVDSYPEEFYEACQAGAMPSSIEKVMKPMKVYLQEKDSYCGIGYSFEVSSINSGVTVSAYKTIATMQEKIEKQLDLARKIRAVDADDVATRVIESHFLPDIYGNFRGFFTQTFRCTRCSAKYRRVPLSGICKSCGSESITLTVHKGGVVKYLEETRKIVETFRVPEYLKSRVENLVKTIEGTFDQGEREISLSDYGVTN
ncbi:MAG: DNA polymerase II large subunit [Candidatus Thermoplasmatota archaeon]|nr:DNA polymerase II large subunit [Candidatus Thermoplasmatota archaeon]